VLAAFASDGFLLYVMFCYQ